MTIPPFPRNPLSIRMKHYTLRTHDVRIKSVVFLSLLEPMEEVSIDESIADHVAQLS